MAHPQATRPPADELARTRAKKLFAFLKAFSEKRLPLRRTLAEQDWHLRFADLPQHESVKVGSVTLSDSEAGESADASDILLEVRRPRLAAAPAPPEKLAEWLQEDWKEPDSSVRVIGSKTVLNRQGVLEIVRFDADTTRIEALERWQARWSAWAETERPARAAMRIFERLYELHGRLERESESLELMIGDGRLRWARTDGLIDHPVLLQKVELHFDASVPEFRIQDADRPPELYSALVHHGNTVSAETFNALRSELEAGGYHPLALDGTQAYLKSLAQRLAARGDYCDSSTNRPATASPRIEHDVVLFLRKRPSGFPAAFDRVLEDLNGSAELPTSLTRLVGVETAPPELPPIVDKSPWGEPQDLLLSKPANAEQIAVARTLARHSSVQVQGPPGTGKTHTIANLIGDLVAKGKRVLVTSHTTKALSVVREKIVEPLRPLCVSVLTSDVDARQQMEEAVKAIIARLSTADEAQLEQNVSSLEEQRAKLNAELGEIAKDLVTAREGEYQPICAGGGQVDPSEAGRWVAELEATSSWIPGSVAAGAPLPLSSDEVAELYLSNAQISADEEAELEEGVPDLVDLLAPEEFELDVKALSVNATPGRQELWSRPASKDELPVVSAFETMSGAFTSQLSRLAIWQRRVVADGYTDGADARGWRALKACVLETCEAYEAAREALLTSDPVPPRGKATDELLVLCGQLEARKKEGKGVGAITLLLHSDWKWFISSATVNGKRPASREDFEALRATLELRKCREKLKKMWDRLATPAHLPDFASLPESPEAIRGYADQFDGLLNWWSIHWELLRAAGDSAGFDWRLFRSRKQAAAQPTLPFELDCFLVAEALPPVVKEYADLCRRDRALKRLHELDKKLDMGRQSQALRDTVEQCDAPLYAERYEALVTLLGKRKVHERRQALLAKLTKAAPGWAQAIRFRRPPHGEESPPSDSERAWRWAQLSQELDRRAQLDEGALMTKLEHRREVLRATTARLIDSKAWLGQLRRTTLKTQQALIGWLNIQKRIGKGTGKRAPKLRAEARKLLSDARDAVPVWIMPLNRVADSFDPVNTKFDVVIIDEASQSDATGLLAWYLGRQVAVVGDNEQVSPLDIGTRIEDIEGLINQYLIDIPNAALYDGKTSIYDLAGMCFGGTIRLREHFRCVPEIIEFSNGLSYSGEIRPLRDGSCVTRPHVTEVHAGGIPGCGRDGKENMAEARLLSAVLAAMLEHPQYAGKTFGAVTLLGDEQAITIQTIASHLSGVAELEGRRFIAGNAAQFQGDERDVMLLSMVDSPQSGPLHMSQQLATKQRYNVAASRAKDQMWLIHSLNPNRDLKEGDLRRRLIEHIRDPLARVRQIKQAQARAESPLESAVIERLISRGFRVEPQVWVGGYRIDLVVGEPGHQVAIECDGDRFHGVEEIPKDMARQAILERCGWRFIRIRGTKFFRYPDKTMETVFSQLERLGVTPKSETEAERESENDCELKQAIIRRAWQVMSEQGWLPITERDAEDDDATANP